ncbi:hypothetical protein ACTJLC_13415 [Paraburkholderia sp. 22099]
MTAGGVAVGAMAKVAEAAEVEKADEVADGGIGETSGGENGDALIVTRAAVAEMTMMHHSLPAGLVRPPGKAPVFICGR